MAKQPMTVLAHVYLQTRCSSSSTLLIDLRSERWSLVVEDDIDYHSR